MTRIEPVQPPYEPDVAERLEAMMPPGVPPIGLFRTFARNLPMTTAMAGWGGYELSRHLSLTKRDREIIIDRTCARCHCEYEWGVHVAFFADQVGLSREHITSLTHGDFSDPCWTEDRDRLLIQAVDVLHDTAHIPDSLWHRIAPVFSDVQILDILLLCGWYHAISFAANGAHVALEDGAPCFEQCAEQTDWSAAGSAVLAEGEPCRGPAEIAGVQGEYPLRHYREDAV